MLTSVTLFDGTLVNGILGGPNPQVDCIGNPYTIAEVAEVLAWITASCHEATAGSISDITVSVVDVPPGAANIAELELEFRFSQRPLPNALGDGACWLGLVRNPVVVAGFPILARPDDTLGLEISLEAMGLLVGASQLTAFNGIPMMKGYNAVLVPTAYSGDFIKWHLILNESGTRIPYSDRRIASLYKPPGETPKVDLIRHIYEKRHVLGWTSQAHYNFGSPTANYKIGWSSPDVITPGSALEKVIISGGPGFLSIGAEIALRRKDISPLIKRDNTAYFESLIFLSNSNIVLYDMRDQRAWLSNGLHVLLHLVRASLEADATSLLASECILIFRDLQEAADISDPQAAVEFLRNRHNLELPLFENPDVLYSEQTTSGGATSMTEHRTITRLLLKDRIRHIMNILEQLIDHQHSVGAPGSSSGIPLKVSPRSRLEGYRFMDIATRRTIGARQTELQIFGGAGKSWVDFVRAIRAVTLFGEGFGELIAPKCSGSTTVCSPWKTLPAGRDYLAVSRYDLARIIQQEGSVSSNPVKLAPGVFWIAPVASPDECVCAGTTACDRAQVLLSPAFCKMFRRYVSHTEGAVVFGRSGRFPWRWPDQGEPKPEYVVEQEDEAAEGETAPKADGHKKLIEKLQVWTLGMRAGKSE
ncbi:hypothetical protein QBC47DRAFT_296752 [Echria macrotheca]|uniref:Uncharacterized protein n=1 Tax=Echria macrotheca TaxID=438768 RepID=A0AAJ0F7C9_9PEZI|nr:hypothetical protein QBC47DRAFT_296752 [Echria macrotheca]